ncbi:MAG: Sensor histidine kinase RcsC [Rhodocyclaceae bacterium]|nr:Sensor histidine kinase RcsC [Rhodocyclaceae bacterium]
MRGPLTALMEQAAEQINPAGVRQAQLWPGAQHSNHWLWPHLRYLIVFGGGLLVAAVIGFGLLMTQQFREVALKDTEERLADLATLLARQTALTLADLDERMLAYAESENHASPMPRTPRKPTSGMSAPELAVELSVIDAGGHLIRSTNASYRPGTDFTDERAWQIHLDRADLGLRLGKPHIDRRSGRWSMKLSRRLAGPNGRFDGVVIASIDPMKLELFSQQPSGGRSVSRAVLTDDEGMVAWDAAGVAEYDSSNEKLRWFMEKWRRSPNGVVRIGEGRGGAPRLVAYRMLSPYPMGVSVTMPEVAALAPAQGRGDVVLRMVAIIAIAGCAVIALCLVAIRSLLASHRRQDELRRVEAEVRTRFEAMIEQTPLVAVQGFGRDGRILHWNRASELMFGEPRARMVGTRAQEYWSNADKARHFESVLTEAWTSGQPTEPMELSLRCRDGRSVQTLASLIPIRENGDVVEVFAMLVDISARHQAEQALRSSERRFRDMADSTQLLIWTAGPDMRCDYVNRYWLSYTGQTTDACLGSKWLGLLHRDDVDSAIRAARTGYFSRRAFEVDYRIRRADGSYRWMQTHAVPWFNADDRLAGYIGTSVDVHDLRMHRERLESEVRSRTAELHAALESAQAAQLAAEQAATAKSQFLANMSHELRTPLHAILSFAALGKRRLARSTPEKLGDYFARIQTSGERLLGLLNDLLDLAKLEAGQATIALQLGDILVPIKEIFAELEALAGDKKLKLALVSSSPSVLAMVDKGKFSQLIRNLMGNAIKFTPAGGTIEVRVGGAPAGTGVELTVADSGVGIPDDELERIFDKFVQSSRTRSGAGGTGLGLAICREIAALHGGTLSARNGANGGAEFTFRLPSAEASPAQTTIPANREASNHGIDERIGGR